MGVLGLVLLISLQKDNNIRSVWAPQSRGIIEWWYESGYLKKNDSLFFFQWTLFHRRGKPESYTLHLVLHDFSSDKHYFFYDTKLAGKSECGEKGDTIFFNRDNWILFRGETLTVMAHTGEFSYNIVSVLSKKPVFYGRDGLVSFGNDKENGKEFYYLSFTRMRSFGCLLFSNSSDTLFEEGEAWFDRQWGIEKIRPWDWFSLRLFDNTEIMLYLFRYSEDKIACFIDQDGRVSNIDTVTYSVEEYITGCGNKRFGVKWSIEVMDNQYEIVPLSYYQFNCFSGSSYWEGLCKIIKEGITVGYAVIETLAEEVEP